MAKTNQKNQPEFPFEVKSGSVIVKIYKVINKGRASYTLSYFSGSQRKQKIFAGFDKAKNWTHVEVIFNAGCGDILSVGCTCNWYVDCRSFSHDKYHEEGYFLYPVPSAVCRSSNRS